MRFATVVVGSNTTAVWKALAAGISTVVPHIFAATITPLTPLARSVQPAVSIASSKADLKRKITTLMHEPKRTTELAIGEATGLGG